MTTSRHLIAGLALAGCLPLAACTAFSGGYVSPVVVTYTPTVTVRPKAASTPHPSAAATSSSAAPVPSDDKGAKHDLGRILDVKDVGGTQVITLDRYQRSGVPSATLAQDGITLTPHRRELFTNASSSTYSIPVRPDATFTKQTCTSNTEPAQTAPSTLDELKNLPGRQGILYFDIDADGYATAITSDPVCQ